MLTTTATPWPRAALLLASDIKLAHSIFALPFAVMAVFLVGAPNGAASVHWPVLAAKLALVVACMVAARTWAMLFNRLVDRRFDADNARTKKRVFAAGLLSARVGWLVAGACALVFASLCAGFLLLFANPWPLYLCVPVLAWIAFYSLTKRFTALCHLFLGGALAASPIAAAIAVEPSALATTPAIFWIAGFVLCWVAGFDIIYALADEAFDRQRGLFSIPAKLGIRGAMWVARVLHLLAAAFLAMAYRSDPRLGPLFGSAVIMIAVLLIVEHIAASRGGKAGLNMAFFTINGIVSCVLGCAGVIDIFLP